MDNIVNITNDIFDNPFLRMSVFLMTGVFIGYTFQPVPKKMSDLFDNSQIFKFIVLFCVGATSYHPINKQKLKEIVFGALVVLGVFHLLRTM